MEPAMVSESSCSRKCMAECSIIGKSRGFKTAIIRYHAVGGVIMIFPGDLIPHLDRDYAVLERKTADLYIKHAPGL